MATSGGADKDKDKEEGGAPVKAIEAIDLEAELKKIVGLTEVTVANAGGIDRGKGGQCWWDWPR